MQKRYNSKVEFKYFYFKIPTQPYGQPKHSCIAKMLKILKIKFKTKILDNAPGIGGP